jgi:hypothetical protein
MDWIFYTDPNLNGWRGNIARAARAQAAHAARGRRKDARSRRIMAARVTDSLAEKAAAKAR